MSYVNVTLYDDADERLRQCLKEAERKFWLEEADRLRKQIENIPAAVKEWGSVTITTRRSEVTLIAKPDDEELSSAPSRPAMPKEEDTHE